MRAAYLDSSAAVKLIVAETESAWLRSWLRGRALLSSTLLRVEVIRAVRPQGQVAFSRAVALMKRVELFGLSRLVLDHAATLDPLSLRTLDAIHLATATLLASSHAVLVSYDDRLMRAADELGLRVVSPAANP